MAAVRWSGPPLRSVSGPGGTFSIEGLRPGKLTVTAQHPVRGLGELETLVLAGDSAPVVVTLAPAGSIAGTVKYQDGGPAEGVEVRATPRWSPVAPRPPV